MDLDMHIDHCKDVKERLVTYATVDDIDDICPIVIFNRNDNVVAIAHAPQVDRDIGLEILIAGAQGYAPDDVVLVVDAHYSQSPINPTTGEAWGPHEMQHACDHEGACAVGVTNDCLMFAACDREGVMQFVNLPYHIDQPTRKVHWLDVEHQSPAAIVEGLVPDAIRYGMSLETLPCDPDDRSWTDAGVTGAIMTKTGAAIMLASSLPREKLTEMFSSIGGTTVYPPYDVD